MKPCHPGLFPVLASIACFLGPMISQAAGEVKSPRPNILFIAIDDLRPELGCYGNTVARSPNIDRVAKSGMVFGRAYCQQAVCSPSRTSMLTGCRPDTTRVWDLSTHFRKALPDVVTMPQHFKNHGYVTRGLGKIYHSGLDDEASWAKHTNVENDTRAPLIISVPGMANAGKTTSALVEFVDIYPSLAELAGLPGPAKHEGLSFKPLIDDPSLPWKSAAFSQYPRGKGKNEMMGYTMRTDQYRFTQWLIRRNPAKVVAIELYDHRNDPQENINVANDPANQALVERLTAECNAGWRAALPKLPN